jgi:hypothetical protein
MKQMKQRDEERDTEMKQMKQRDEERNTEMKQMKQRDEEREKEIKEINGWIVHKVSCYLESYSIPFSRICLAGYRRV